jgi:hypothetical protein
MRRRDAGIACTAVEKVIGSASADVQAMVSGQAEIEDVGAAVIERNPLAPTDLGQLLFREWLRHGYVFVYG